MDRTADEEQATSRERYLLQVIGRVGKNMPWKSACYDSPAIRQLASDTLSSRMASSRAKSIGFMR